MFDNNFCYIAVHHVTRLQLIRQTIPLESHTNTNTAPIIIIYVTVSSSSLTSRLLSQLNVKIRLSPLSPTLPQLIRNTKMENILHTPKFHAVTKLPDSF